MDEKDKKEYELAVLVKNEEDLAPVVALIKKHNGEIVAEPHAKRLALAYEIKKNKEAVFAYCTFKAAGADVKDLEAVFNTTPEVIRAMIIISPPPTPAGDRTMTMPQTGDSTKYRSRPTRSPSAAPSEAKPAAPKPLSNEALEKKIEEILQ